MPRVYEMGNVPAVADYVRGLTAIRARVRETHLRIFQTHYSIESRRATAKQLAALAEVDGG